MSVNVYSNSSSQLALSKELKKKFTKTFDLSQIAEDPMDCYLDTLGLWKKRIARDGSCLFRAVAEQIYPCQMHHERVRQECIKYMSDHRETYSKYLTSISFDDYLEAMKNTYEYAGQLEIAAMSNLYKRDFIVYHHPDQSGLDVTQNGFEKKIYLCYSYNNHFDAIFTKSHRDNLALIQSLVYEILYDKVFGSGEQVAVARRLLRKSDTIYPKEYMNLKISNEFGNELDFDEDEEAENERELLDEINEIDEIKNDIEKDENNNENINDLSNDCDTVFNDENKYSDKKLSKLNESDDNKSFQTNKTDSSISPSFSEKNNSQIHKMPLPYKVAKSLDPVIYRNTAFDAWLAAKKEYEETLNQKAISTLQPGDKCLIKLNNNYSEKWNLAYVHTIQHDLANVFVAELNENHCIPLENLKPYTSGNDSQSLLHINNSLNGHHYGHNYHNILNQNNSLLHSNNVKNVQKLVQSINSQFSKIFISSENKRRSLKKKQFSIKKSSSFHAFSTELPTLIEVEEQLEESFGFNSHHYYFNDQQNHSFNAINASNSHIQTNYHNNHLTSFAINHHQNRHHNQQHMTHSQTYYSMPHNSNYNETKLNGNKLTSSVSASDLNNVNMAGFNNTNKNNILVPNVQSIGNSNINLASIKNNNNLTQNFNADSTSKGQRRNQRFNQTPNNFENSNNFGFNNKAQQQWPNNFLNNNSNNHLNSYMPSQHHHLSQIQPPLLNNQPFLNHNPSVNNAFNSSMNLPPLNAQGGFLPPSMGPIQTQPLGMNSSLPLPLPPPQFMHGPPLPPLAPQLGPISTNNNNNHLQHGNQPRQNFFNPNSNYMFGPSNHSVPGQLPSSNLLNSHLINGENNNNSGYYFSNGSNQCNPLINNSTTNNFNNKFQNNQRKSSDNFSHNKSNNYQTNSQNITTSNGANDLQSNGFQANTSNYLLMPAPTNKTNNKNMNNNVPSANNKMLSSNTGSLKPETSASSAFDNNNISSGLSRSHSYHSGVSTQSYDLSNNSNVYVDVYMPQQSQQPHLQHCAQNNAIAASNQQDSIHNSITNNLNMNNMNNNASSNSISGLNDLNSLMNSNNNYQNYPAANNSNNSTNNIGLDGSNMTYGSNNFQNYEVQYPRFDNSVSNGGLIEDSFLLNSNDHNNRQNNTWNKGNRLTKSTSVFNDMLYSSASAVLPTSNTNNTSDKNNQFCYSNCLVVNIDGPINFNATHSLLDDGSDLPFNDINTIRFFYNVGIEYYRLNLATPYNQPNSYPAAPCYGPPQPPPLSMPVLPSAINTSNATIAPLPSTNNQLGVTSSQQSIPASSSNSNISCTSFLNNNTSNQMNKINKTLTEISSAPTCSISKEQQPTNEMNNHFNPNGQQLPKNGKQQQANQQPQVTSSTNRRNY